MEKRSPLWAVLHVEQQSLSDAGCRMRARGLLAGRNQVICSVQGGLVSSPAEHMVASLPKQEG